MWRPQDMLDLSAATLPLALETVYTSCIRASLDQLEGCLPGRRLFNSYTVQQLMSPQVDC